MPSPRDRPWQRMQAQAVQRRDAKQHRLIKASDLRNIDTRVEAERAMLQIAPGLAKPLKKALSALQSNRLVEALQHFEECAKIDPTNKAVLYFGSDAAQRAYFGLKYADPKPRAKDLAKWREAAYILTLACHESSPADAVALHNVARFLQDDARDAESIPFYEKALQLDRAQVESWGNMGNALDVLGERERAEIAWSKCVAFDPINPSAHMAQAYVWLRRGDYLRGWKALNERWRDQSFAISYGRSDLKGKPWTGQPLRKREKLLIHGEQGLGDHVHFGRYVTLLIEQGLPIAGIETRKPLRRWFEALFPNLNVVCRFEGDPIPEHTHQVPMVSLPGILGGIVPPVLSPVQWAPRAVQLSEKTRRVGLIWHGTPGNPMDYARSVPTECLSELADMPGVTWVPLQYDETGRDALTARLWLGESVEQAPIFADVLELAEIMAGLDMVVTVDTLAGHVAGSVGVPTVMLHRFSREWRWGSYSEECRWYPSVRHLTCPRPNAWRELLQQARERLTQRP